MPFRIIFSAVAYVGAVVPLALVWEAADMFNAFMAVPNLIALVLLSGVIVKETKKYLWDNNLDAVSTDELPVV